MIFIATKAELVLPFVQLLFSIDRIIVRQCSAMLCAPYPSASHGDKRYNHLFHRDAAMLECVFIVRHIVIVIVGIGKEGVARSKYV